EEVVIEEEVVGEEVEEVIVGEVVIEEEAVEEVIVGEEENSDQSSSRLAESSYRDRFASVPVTDTVPTFVALPEGAGSSLSPITDPVAVLTVSSESSLSIGDDVLVSAAEVADSDLVVLEDELPTSSPASLFLPQSELVVADDISLSSLLPSAEDLVAVGVASESRGTGDELFLHLSSPSIEPYSSSSSSCLSSSPSESGLYADISYSSSPDSPVLTREVGLTSEVTVSESGVLLGESIPASSSEKLVVDPVVASSSVSTVATGESSMAASGSSSSYPYGPKKAFIMKLAKEPFETPTGGDVIAGPSSSAPVANISPVAAATDDVNEEEDIGARLAALLNRGLPPSPPTAIESGRSARGGRGRLSSSHQGSARRGRGRKRKRNE
ncbi:hypothetical protein, partial [Candidatus Ichthyocystis sparus]